MELATVLIASATGDATYTESIDCRSTDATPGPLPRATMMPAALDAGQVYYWGHVWQSGERQSREELARGESRTFEQAHDAIRWLLGDDG